MTELTRLSASKIKTFMSCNKKYQYRYIDKVPYTRTTALVLGTAIHKAIELGYQGEDPQRVFYDAWHAQLAEEGIEHNAKEFNRGMRMLLVYDFEKRKPIASEVEFILPFPSAETPICEIHGYLDQVYDWGFVDLKSGKRAPKVEQLEYDIQFIIYAYAFYTLYDQRPEKAIWHHLDGGIDIIVPDLLETVKFDTVMDSILSLLQSNKTELYPRRIAMDCGWCEYAKTCLGKHVEEEGIDS